MEEIIIHCPTEELWNRVQAAVFAEGKEWSSGGKNILDYWHDDTVESCINTCNYYLERHNRSYYKDKGHTIISAQEYLNEGGKDVSEFKVGDRVNHNDGFTGVIVNISSSGNNIHIQRDDKSVGSKPYVASRSYINLATKPKTTKENNMNISDNILEVFTTSKDAKKVANRFGDQYGNKERDLLALRRDKTDLLAIIKDEEDEVKKAVKK